MDVKDILKERRIQLGYSVNELGKKLGVSGSTVSRWETGEIDNMGRKKIAKLSKILGISPTVILELNEPPAKNIIMPDAYSIPILDRISCGSGSSINHEYAGEFVLDRSIKADYCLIASGDSMIDAGIEDGDRVFMRKVTEYKDGKIYGVVLRSEDTATLKRVYFQEDKVLLQPCNPSYKPVCLSESEVYIVGECIGIFKTI